VCISIEIAHKKFHQNTFTFIFKRATNEEMETTFNIKMFNAYVLPNRFSLKQVEKRPVGRPQKHVVQLLPNQEISKRSKRKAKKTSNWSKRKV
jgi:hypothetical protein